MQDQQHPQQPAPDFGEPWQNEVGDFEIYPRAGGDAIAYAEGVKTRDRIIATMNACASMRDPAAEIQALRDVVKKAETALMATVKDGTSSLETMKLVNSALQSLA